MFVIFFCLIVFSISLGFKDFKCNRQFYRNSVLRLKNLYFEEERKRPDDALRPASEVADFADKVGHFCANLPSKKYNRDVEFRVLYYSYQVYKSEMRLHVLRYRLALLKDKKKIDKAKKSYKFGKLLKKSSKTEENPDEGWPVAYPAQQQNYQPDPYANAI